MSDDAAALRNRDLPLAAMRRLAYVSGVEERSREAGGRGLTEDEPRLALRQYPGDPVDVAARHERERRGGMPESGQHASGRPGQASSDRPRTGRPGRAPLAIDIRPPEPVGRCGRL
jgi:hypothetical protein